MAARFLYFFPILLLCNIGYSQTANNISTIATLARQVEHFGTGLPQEKVYLHIDNTCYFLGDTIRYKAYVTRSDKGTLTDLSKIMYAELLTPDGFLVERQQLKMENGTAHGAFTLTDSLYAGYYEIRAYTRWMLNFGKYEHRHSQYTEKMFYNKQMARDFFRDYDKIYSRVFPVFDKTEEKEPFTKNMTLRPMRRYYKEKKGKKGIDLRFYPEGGHLIEGTNGRVAFELNDEEGRHMEAEIIITDGNGNEITRTRTVNRGRGVFTISDIGTKGKYKAKLNYQGDEYKVELPEVEKEGFSLYVSEEGEELNVTIQGKKAGDEELGLQVQCNGVSRFFCHVTHRKEHTHTTVRIPVGQLQTGVNQITLFNAEGTIYADRLCFINRQDYGKPRIEVEGGRKEYGPFEPIELKLKLLDGEQKRADISLAVRDRATDEQSYDNGTMLTEMLLASEIKGFVENPEWYFQKDDSIHKQALDLLMMVQGWRRHEWRRMAGVDRPVFEFLPEKIQTLSGSVHKTFSLLEETYYGDSVYLPTIADTSSIYTTAPDYSKLINILPGISQLSGIVWTLQDLYGPFIKKMKKEVSVSASFIQNTDIVEATQTTINGKFYIPSATVYENYILFLSASDSTKNEKHKNRMKKKGFMDEQAYPEFYVKLNTFFPVFPKPYCYYQDIVFEEKIDMQDTDSTHTASFTDRKLNTVTVMNKRGGLRKLDFSKPAIVVDAYHAFNLAADYGLNGGMHDWRTFARQIATAFFGDMGMDRHFDVEEQYDGISIDIKPNHLLHPLLGNNQTEFDFANQPHAESSLSNSQMEKYRRLHNLDKLYIYTDYVPREQGSWKYRQANQPDVVIDYRLLPDETRRPTYRDRRYAAKGYAICTDFYSPDYSKKPLSETHDYRRTLYWTPKVEFDEKGEAAIKLYNNSKKTVIAVEAEGITDDGKPVVWKTPVNTQP